MTCCLYFIAPHRLKDNDVAFMKEISKLLPIVPVIAKADTMTSQETTDFRKEVSEKMRQANIRLYDFEHDPRIADKPDLPPFTLITDRSMKERVYAWGTCEMNNAAHSDFTLLKDLVIKKHLEVVYVYTHTHSCFTCLLAASLCTRSTHLLLPPSLHLSSVFLACLLAASLASFTSLLLHRVPRFALPLPSDTVSPCRFFLTRFRANS